MLHDPDYREAALAVVKVNSFGVREFGSLHELDCREAAWAVVKVNTFEAR